MVKNKKIKSKEKNQTLKIILILFIAIGFVLILDGIVSIYLQPTQSALFQAGRIARTFMGSTILIISFLLYRK
jgi:cell division septal protein FtsQ